MGVAPAVFVPSFDGIARKGNSERDYSDLVTALGAVEIPGLRDRAVKGPCVHIVGSRTGIHTKFLEINSN